jgi:Na+-driven multidrug efflux pump
MEFQSFFIAAEKPTLGLIVTVAAGVTNMVLDFLLVGVLPLGLVGAAMATGISQAVGGIIPLIYFAFPNNGLLRLSKTKFEWRVLIKTCTNGSSELMSNIAMSTVSILYNAKLLELEGENGVAAYGVLMYVGFIFFAAFIGYTIGIAPIISYNYGASNHTEMQGLFKRSIVIVGIFSLSTLALSESLAYPLSLLFVGYDTQLFALSCHAFSIYSFSFLFAGYAIFCSGFFTALNDGLTSALISFLRTLVFQVAAVLLLPLILGGIEGIWWSVVVAEIMAVVFSLVFLIAKRKKYEY